MPGRIVHKCVGAGAGAVYAGFQAKDQTGAAYWLEVIGGSIGGYTTSMLPDKFEPAVSSWHRGPFHSAVAAGVAAGLSAKLEQWSTICRAKANAKKAPQLENTQTGERVALPRSTFEELVAQIVEWFWRLLAGFLNGLAAGYVSHVALDAVVGSRSIPLFLGTLR